MLALGLHLYHGFWSAFQTLGFNSYKTNTVLRALAMLVSVGLTVGFVLVPLAVLFGISSVDQESQKSGVRMVYDRFWTPTS